MKLEVFDEKTARMCETMHRNGRPRHPNATCVLTAAHRTTDRQNNNNNTKRSEQPERHGHRSGVK
jgi:predicted RNA polymerase sigma factor